MFERSVIGRMWIRLPFWTRRGHSDIVAPYKQGISQKRFGLEMPGGLLRFLVLDGARYCVAVMFTTSSRSLGPSSSISTIRCQVPSRTWPCSNGSVTDVPISDDRM